jgi:poly(A) polymerase
VAGAVAARLRLSRSQRERLVTAAERLASDADNPRALAYRVGMGGAIDRLLLEGSNIRVLEGWSVPRFPLKGGAIVERGISAGPEVARIMRQVEQRWIEEGFPDGKRIDQILSEYLPD